MTSLSVATLSAEFLVHCLNVAIGSVVACAIALILSRRQTWSLPARHVLLVVGLAAGLLAPLAALMIPMPALWTIRGPQIASRPATSGATSAADRVEVSPAAAAPAFEALPNAEPSADRSIDAESAAILPSSAASTPLPHPSAPLGEQPSVAVIDWPTRIGTLLCALWFAGIVAGFFRAILRVVRFRRWMQTVSAVESPLLAAAARRAADAVGLRNEVTVYSSSLLPAPVTLGLTRPRIVVPAGIESLLPSDQLRAVIQHEMAHIARHDLWIGLLQQIVNIIYWWNPLVRILNLQLADLREQICDDIAIRELREPDSYAATLINIAERCSLCLPIPTTLGIGPSPARQLEGRIRRIVSSPRTDCVRLSRRAAAGVSAVTVLMAATILMAQIQIEPPAAAETDDRLAAIPVEQANARSNDQPSAPSAEQTESVEAPQNGQPEKPMTLDELRPLVIDQIRSIRSLYVAYSRSDPAEFGGKSHDHVWAEQGFKLLKYDLPGKDTVQYASTFDGKQTYIGGFEKDKPVRAYIKSELIPGFHESLMGNAIVGWLHFAGQRDSIVDLLRAPQATLVDSPAADGNPRPTIEIKNYSRAGHFPLNARVVLDPAHGFLPQTIAWDSVNNPEFRYAYEVDEFQLVRDGATGADRWFPMRARYIQRSNQVWIHNVTKLQINDVLPDDLFVLAPTTPTAAPGQEAAAMAEFEKAYHLDPDQLVRQVKPPYLPGRMVNLKKWWASAFAQSDYEHSGTFLPMVYPERDGKLGSPGFRFTSGVGQTGIPASELLNAVGAALNLTMREVDDPDKLLKSMVEGDFVIRADAPAEKVVAALGELLKKDCSIPVELELRQIEHPVVAVGGRINPPFVIEPETVVELYVTEPPFEKGAIEIGTFYDLLKAVARFIDPERRVVNQVENAPYRNEKISWRRTPLAGKGKAALDDDEARAVLDHLEQQTGLTFTLESRKFPTTFVRRSK
jgi:beta-lactamase regulating signal transducer with metallopeptidase domain